MNETIKTLLERRSIRKFKLDQIKEEDLNAILEAGMYAPSGANQQSALFIVIQDKETLKKISAMNAAVLGKDIDPYYNAPTVILVLRTRARSHRSRMRVLHSAICSMRLHLWASDRAGFTVPGKCLKPRKARIY